VLLLLAWLLLLPLLVKVTLLLLLSGTSKT